MGSDFDHGSYHLKQKLRHYKCDARAATSSVLTSIQRIGRCPSETTPILTSIERELKNTAS